MIWRRIFFIKWLPICKGGFAPSAVVVGGKLMSVVEGMTL